MFAKLTKYLIRLSLISVLGLVAILGWRVYSLEQGPPLELWHTYMPHELDNNAIKKANWDDYIAAENQLFDEVKINVTDKLDESQRRPSNRYFEGSPLYPNNFEDNWNHSYIKTPDTPVKGIAVLLHGLTDSPYSLRHVAMAYQRHGYVVVAIRLPGHGTIPSGLVDVDWESWVAATQLAVREGRRLGGTDVPLHLVGFSNGGALAMKYALDALEDQQLSRPDRIFLISPMIGITQFARFAGVAAWPAYMPRFSKAAWLGIVPEFNPFKYNSFPVNGAVQSHRLTTALQQQINRLNSQGRLGELSPIMTFQSVMDFTVSTPAVVNSLYNLLPQGGHELILFDVNQNTKVNVLFRNNSSNAINRILPDAPRRYTTSIIANIDPSQSEVELRTTPEMTTQTTRLALGLHYPLNVFSLSHVAIPFPSDDSLYGQEPVDQRYGINLGTMAMRGEVGVLVVNTDSLTRMSSNPFFPYLLGRIEEHM